MQHLTLQEHFNNYINECEFIKRLRPETIRGAREAFRCFVTIVPEVQSTNDLSIENVTVFFVRLQTRIRQIGKDQQQVGIRDSTVLAYSTRLKTFFKWLYERRHIPQNPFDSLQLPQPVYSDKRFLTGEQIKKIMGAIAQNSSSAFLLKRDLAIVGVLTFCGLRRNEFISLEVSDIDLFNNYIVINGKTSKSKKTRRIPINAQLRMHLQEYLQERKKRGIKTSRLFVSNCRDSAFTLHGVKHWTERIKRLSGVTFHLHRFRHTFATNLAMQNVGIIKIQKLMGHTDIKMTQTYLRSVATEDLKDDVAKLSYESLA